METSGVSRRLVYHISDVDHPGDVKTRPNAAVDAATTHLVRIMNPSAGPFPGLTVTMERLAGGQWRNNVKLLQGEHLRALSQKAA